MFSRLICTLWTGLVLPLYLPVINLQQKQFWVWTPVTLCQSRLVPAISCTVLRSTVRGPGYWNFWITIRRNMGWVFGFNNFLIRRDATSLSSIRCVVNKYTANFFFATRKCRVSVLQCINTLCTVNYFFECSVLSVHSPNPATESYSSVLCLYASSLKLTSSDAFFSPFNPVIRIVILKTSYLHDWIYLARDKKQMALVNTSVSLRSS
jgi:hypothetical protein